MSSVKQKKTHLLCSPEPFFYVCMVQDSVGNVMMWDVRASDTSWKKDLNGMVYLYVKRCILTV